MGYFLACSKHNINTLLLGGGEGGGVKTEVPRKLRAQQKERKGIVYISVNTYTYICTQIKLEDLGTVLIHM